MAEFIVAVAQSAGASADLDESVMRHARLASRAATLGARLLIFPELSLTGYHLRFTACDAIEVDDARLQPLQQIADAHEMVMMAGAPINSERGLHIGSVGFMPHGPRTTYLKNFLGGIETDAFCPGPPLAPLALDDQLIAPAICADITHPEHPGRAAENGATIYAASCLLSQENYPAEARLLQRYASEHRMLVMMANYAPPVPDWLPAGRSAIWSGDGSLLACAEPDGEALVLASRTHDGWSGRVERT